MSAFLFALLATAAVIGASICVAVASTLFVQAFGARAFTYTTAALVINTLFFVLYMELR